MHRDEIIAEVRRNRDAYAEKHNHDLGEMARDLQERQRKSASRIVDRRNLPGASGNEASAKDGSRVREEVSGDAGGGKWFAGCQGAQALSIP